MQQGVLLFSFLFCFLLWLVFVCFSFIFVAIFSYFFAVVAGRRFFCGGAFSRDFFCFFSRFFFWVERYVRVSFVFFSDFFWAALIRDFRVFFSCFLKVGR